MFLVQTTLQSQGTGSALVLGAAPSAPCLPPAPLQHSWCPVPDQQDLAWTPSTPSPFYPSLWVANPQCLPCSAGFPSPAPPGLGGDGGGPRGTKGTLGWQVLLLLSVIQKK